jgi:hypothetical protein
MLLNEQEAAARLKSPLNLINRLKDTSRKGAMNLFTGGGNNAGNSVEVLKEIVPMAAALIKPSPFNPFDKPQEVLPEIIQPIELKADDIISDPDRKIKLSIAHDRALEVLTSSVELLATKLDDVRADKLPSVIAATSKVVESIRRERNESAKNNKDREVHYHFYTPEQKKIIDYNVIEVTQ